VFDAMGRVSKQGLTFFELGTDDNGFSDGGFVGGVPLHATLTTYDALGRPIIVTRPADPDFKTGAARTAVTTTVYDLGTAPGGSVRRLRTAVTDANGHVRLAYRALADRVVAVEERPTEPGQPTSAVTRYLYNPVGELTQIADAQGHLTTIVYDLLGKKTLIANPDAGQIDFTYDAMGNMVRKQDGNLSNRSGPMPYIRYEYDLDRLVGIRYPEGSATMDVKFEYGPPGAAGNGAGRIVRVVDGAGEEKREYGALGDVILTRRTLRPLKPLEAPLVFETRFDFDEWGRMNWITYPDRETVRYEYDRGGRVNYARGDRPATVHYPAASEVYLQFMTYDEFGQRRTAKLGNGAVTKYAYYPQNHRLSWVETFSAGRKLQNLTYGYDLVGSVTFESNGLGPATDIRSGDVSYEFLYDSLDRLKWAKGTAAARPGVTDEFETAYTYSAIHNMTSNKQVHKVTTITDLATDVAYPPHTNHDFIYTYDDAKPHQAKQIGNMFLTYDFNGNTKSECRDHADPTCSVNHDHYREYGWTEDNRLASVIDGGGRSVTRFLYDAAGERLVKFGSGGASITIGQFFNVKGRTAATKHVFAGTARLASKLLPPGDYASPTLGATIPATTATGPTTGTGSTGTNPVGDGSPNDTGCVPSDYQPQKCPILVNGEPVVPYPFQDTKVRPETYYYHPDHLRSTSWVTDQNGKVHEHVEYFPYGEVWRDPVSDRDGAGVKGQRFLFSGKELDETGLYYFGARYLDPQRARWISPDPLTLTQASPANGTSNNDGTTFLVQHVASLQRARWPRALSAYAYVGWTPLSYDDPDGLAERGDVVFFNWGDPVQDWPRHAAIATKVDSAGNPTHVFGAWEDTMTFHEVDLSKYHGGVKDNIIGTGSMKGLSSISVEQLVKTWSGRAVAENWSEHGEPGPVCLDACTAADGLGGPKLRSEMNKDLGSHPQSYKDMAKRSGTSAPQAGKDSLYRRNMHLWQFFKNTNRYTDEHKKK